MIYLYSFGIDLLIILLLLALIKLQKLWARGISSWWFSLLLLSGVYTLYFFNIPSYLGILNEELGVNVTRFISYLSLFIYEFYNVFMNLVIFVLDFFIKDTSLIRNYTLITGSYVMMLSINGGLYLLCLLIFPKKKKLVNKNSPYLY